jgi:hypothetical protein
MDKINHPELLSLKGTVSRDFLLLVFFVNQFPPSPRVFHLDHFKFFQKFAEKFASQGAPLVSATPVANFSTIFASVIDTGGKFATGVNDAGSKLPPVSLTPVANNGNNIRLQTPYSELEGKNLYICLLYYPKVSKQNY